MASTTQSYPLVRKPVVVLVTDQTTTDEKSDEGVEIDVASILSVEEAKEPALEAKIDETTVGQPAEEPALQANTDQTNEQPAEEPAKENEMNQSQQQTPDQRNLATFNVVGQPLPPEQDMLTINQKPAAEPFFKFWRVKMTGRDFCLFLLIAAMAVTIVYLLAVRTTSSTKLPPAIIVEEPASRRAIIVDGGSTKPAADMATDAVNDLANNTTPAEDMAAIKTAPRMPAAANGKPAATTTPEQTDPSKADANDKTEATFPYKLAEGQWVRSAMMACKPGMKEKDAMAWFQAHNPKIKNPNKVAAGTEIQTPCQLTTKKVWWGQARGVCLSGPDEAKKGCLKAAKDWLK